MIKTVSRFEVVLIILLLLTCATLAVVTSGVLTQTVVGPKGDTGLTGPQGPKGDMGLTGATGPRGLPGMIGAKGANGEAGTQGPKGDTGVAGETGANGTSWFSGSGAPASSLGNDGDFYLELANNNVYNKVLGIWTIVTNIEGKPGEAGAAGAVGATGATGPQGPPGVGVVIRYNNTYAHSSIGLTTDYKAVSNVTLTAPSNGYVILNFNALAIIEGDSTIAAFGLGSTSDTYPELCNTYAGASSGEDTTTYHPISLQAVVPVNQGITYTFYANGYLVMAVHPANLYYIHMTGIFYPA